jgi:hypothetical protein
VTGSRDSKHVHLDDLDAQDNSSARNVARSSQIARGSDACCVCRRPGGRRLQDNTRPTRRSTTSG